MNAFDNAVRVLRGRGLVSDTRDGNLIALANGSRAEEVVRVLVEERFAVHEIAPHEETLDAFYLSLMNGAPVSKPAGSADRSPRAGLETGAP